MELRNRLVTNVVDDLVGENTCEPAKTSRRKSCEPEDLKQDAVKAFPADEKKGFKKVRPPARSSTALRVVNSFANPSAQCHPLPATVASTVASTWQALPTPHEDRRR